MNYVGVWRVLSFGDNMNILIYSVVTLTILILIMMVALGYYEDRKERLQILIGTLVCWMIYAFSTLLRSTHMNYSDFIDTVFSYIF